LTGIGLNFADFSECALISLKAQPDFDSTMRRFESSRPELAVPLAKFSACYMPLPVAGEIPPRFTASEGTRLT
jgi:hypothetical protein